MSHWNEEKRINSQIERGCTFRTVDSLKISESIIILYHNQEQHLDRKTNKFIRRKPYPIHASVVYVNKEHKFVSVCYLDGYKSRNAHIPFSQCIAVYNPNAKEHYFANIHGNSDILCCN